jgi:hypothetical protein
MEALFTARNLSSISFFVSDISSWLMEARGSVVDYGTMLQTGRSRVRFPMKPFNFSSRTMALGSTQPLTEFFLGGKGMSASKADNHTTIFEPTA